MFQHLGTSKIIVLGVQKEGFWLREDWLAARSQPADKGHSINPSDCTVHTSLLPRTVEEDERSAWKVKKFPSTENFPHSSALVLPVVRDISLSWNIFLYLGHYWGQCFVAGADTISLEVSSGLYLARWGALGRLARWGKWQEIWAKAKPNNQQQRTTQREAPAPALFMFHIFLITGLVSSLTNILDIFLPFSVFLGVVCGNFVLSQLSSLYFTGPVSTDRIDLHLRIEQINIYHWCLICILSQPSSSQAILVLPHYIIDYFGKAKLGNGCSSICLYLTQLHF